MPCAGPDHSCNSLLSVRSPLGEVCLAAPGSGGPESNRPSLFARLVLALREMAAHRRQRQALAALDEHGLQDIGVSAREAEREIHKPFWK